MRIILLALILILAIVIAIMCTCRKEAFTIPSKDINSAIVFACYSIDKFDYEFIKKWCDTATFYIVVNGNPTEWDDKVKDLSNVRYMRRANSGYDTTAWKEAMIRWENELRDYDSVVLANNSCIYAIDLIDILSKADGYDMYGLYKHSKINPDILMSNPKYRFLHTYFIVIGKRLYNSGDFKEYWCKMPEIKHHDDACIHHENRFSMYFDSLGYRIGVYICNINPEVIYEADPRPANAPYRREFVKRKVSKNVLDEFMEKVYKKHYPNEEI